MPSTY